LRSIVAAVCLGDWSVFKNTYATPGGMAIVRGFMNQSVPEYGLDSAALLSRLR
jgi:hypothetical protein